MEELTRPEPFEGTNSSSNYIPWKYFTKFQCNSGWSIFERVVLVSLIVSNFALLLIVLPVVSSNSIKLSYISDNLESSHGFHKNFQIVVNKSHGIMNLIKEQVDWIKTTQEQMKGVIFTKLDHYETEFSKFDAILEKSNSIEDRAQTINADQQLIKSTQKALARRTNEIECSIGSDVSEGLVSESNDIGCCTSLNSQLDSLLQDSTATGWNVNCDMTKWNPDSWFQTFQGHNCKNFFGWNGHRNTGSINTTLLGSGIAKLSFGNCHNNGYAEVLLDGNVIASADKLVNEKEVEFTYKHGSHLIIQEHEGILEFNYLKIIQCNDCSAATDNPSPSDASTLHGYIVVQRSPPIVKGPYSDLQVAKNELTEIAKNGKSRMMLEIIDGAIQVEWDQVHNINGVYQSPENGFDRYNQNWDDILGMIEIAKQHLILHKKNFAESTASGRNTLSNQKCKQEGLRYKIDTLTNLIKHSQEVTAVNKDELDSKVDSTLSKVEGLMAKSGEIEIRFDEVDNIHREIKDEQRALDEKVENIINAINDLKKFLPTKGEEDEVQIETTTKSSPFDVYQVRLNNDEIAEIYYSGKWMPICGHHFWNNNNGATLFCQKLGYQKGIIKQESKSRQVPLPSDGFRIGECKKNDIWPHCAGGCSDHTVGGTHCSDCQSGAMAGLKIECSDKDEVQIETTTKSSSLCSLDYPFAYWNGHYCCKTSEERPVELGITPQNEIDDGTCDGVDFNRQSKCCKSERAPCPHRSECFDNDVELDGPFGGTQTSWTDINHSIDFGSITKVQIRSGSVIDAIRFQYGETWGPWHGSNQGDNSEPIELQHGERIIKIQGTTNPNFYNVVNVISSIEFHTNQGRKIGPYGQSSSNDVPWAIEREQCALAWIAGDSSKHNLMNQSGYIRSLSFKFQC